MDISAVLQEIGTVLSTCGVNVYTQVPDASDYPAIVIQPPTNITYSTTFGGQCKLDVPVSLFVSAGDLGTAWALLYKLLSYNTPDNTIPDVLTAHTPTSYRTVQVQTAGGFASVGGGTGITVDVNLIIHS